MRKSAKLITSALLSTALIVPAFSFVQAKKMEDISAEKPNIELSVPNISTNSDEFIKKDLSVELPIEEPQTEKLSTINPNDIVYLDELEYRDDIGIMAVTNFNQFILSGNLSTIGTNELKMADSTISWNVVWDGTGDARIGAVGQNDGIFYYLSGTGGSSNRKMTIPKSQYYKFAIRNLDSRAVTFSGWRDL